MSSSSFNKIIVFTIFICFVLAIGASLIQNDPIPKNVSSEYPLCTILPSSIEFAEEEQAKYVGDSRLYWPKHSEISVLIMDGAEEARKKVMKYADEWAKASGLSFKRVFTISVKPKIKVSFNCNGYNSLVGQQALNVINTDSPTMCLQGLDKTTDEEIFKRTVLHEFGHALGLLHELQNPTEKIPWNIPKLYNYYKSVYDWNPDQVDKWVLRPAYEQYIDYSDFDPFSIMMYAVPDSLTNGHYSYEWPKTLSKIDKEKIKHHYQ